MDILTFLLLVLAIEHLTDILVNVDLLEPMRESFESKYPKYWKLARCRFCQAFWFTGSVFLFAPGLFGFANDATGIADAGLSWLVMHKAVVLLTEATERFLGRAPSTHNVIVQGAERPPLAAIVSESES